MITIICRNFVCTIFFPFRLKVCIPSNYVLIHCYFVIINMLLVGSLSLNIITSRLLVNIISPYFDIIILMCIQTSKVLDSAIMT